MVKPRILIYSTVYAYTVEYILLYTILYILFIYTIYILYIYYTHKIRAHEAALYEAEPG